MKNFENDGALRLLVDSVKLYSPTGREGALSSFLAETMRTHGFDNVRQDEAGNAIGEVGRGKIRVLLCGHMDTIPGRLPVLLEEGRLSGRGSVDAKSPMCAMLVAASRFIGDPELSLTVACVTGEEGNSLGIQTLMKNNSNYDFAVFGEPGGAGKVTVGYRGRLTLHVEVFTGGGHAGAPWAHRSAFDEASDLIGSLRKFEREHSRDGDHYHSVSVSPTLFQAGEYHNVIPARARFTCDVRVPPGSSTVALERDLNKVITSFANSRGITVNHDFGEPTEPHEASSSSLLVRAFQRGILLQARSRPVLLRKTGTGDMNTFAAVKRAECITYGPGDAILAHTDGEAIEIEDYLRSIEVMSEAFRQVKHLSKREPNV